MPSLESCAWRLGDGLTLALDQPRIMGILNVTPDSFSDGGQHADAKHAIDAAMRMRDEGACIIDVGGESTRPGAKAVEVDEQIRRTLPVIQGLRNRCSAAELLISIDTTRAAVARVALDAGANIINDVSAGRDDPDILPLTTSHGCGLILMHRLASPANDSFSHQYSTEPDYAGDVVAAVRAFLMERVDAAMRAGVRRESIVIDPGLGFGKSVEQNVELIRRTGEIVDTGFPILSAASRKSFIGKIIEEPEPSRRDAASAAVSVLQWLSGVSLFRVHDVLVHRQVLDVAHALNSDANRGMEYPRPIHG